MGVRSDGKRAAAGLTTAVGIASIAATGVLSGFLFAGTAKAVDGTTTGTGGSGSTGSTGSDDSGSSSSSGSSSTDSGGSGIQQSQGGGFVGQSTGS